MIDEAQYLRIINIMLLVNTVWVLGYAVLCFHWATIARTGAKKMIFGGFGGALGAFVMLRIAVAILPTNLDLLLLIGVLHGLMMAIMFTALAMVTAIVKRRAKEVELAEKCRREACVSPLAQDFDDFQSKLIEFGREHGFC